jgi:hypothetical protein
MFYAKLPEMGKRVESRKIHPALSFGRMYAVDTDDELPYLPLMLDEDTQSILHLLSTRKTYDIDEHLPKRAIFGKHKGMKSMFDVRRQCL